MHGITEKATQNMQACDLIQNDPNVNISCKISVETKELLILHNILEIYFTQYV